MAFYENYVKLCNSVGKSPSAVAVELKLGKPSVTRWKNGAEPRDATLQKIADYFGVTVEYLKGEETKKAPATNGEVSPEKRELLDLIDSLSDDQCGKLSNIIKEAINLL
jgi:transcriptional regulator with XRE-family HTH domain|nr:MAG TPA: helix-turn-helix domain protein [Caudoviricetes sp.]